MEKGFSLLYGFSLIMLVYWISYRSVKGLMGKGSIPFYLTLAKYFIYWKMITLGFEHLQGSWILIGTVVGIYLSLPLFYFLNKKYGESNDIVDQTTLK
jgi:hypothetical protein